MKLLVVFAGPNGSGKSTIVAEAKRRVSCFPEIFINPDEIIRQYFPGNAREGISYAAYLRKNALNLGHSFAIETITSPMLLRNAKARGYRVELLFVTTCNPEINKARVSSRVAQGGHYIPPPIIEENYYRSMRNLADVVKLSDTASVYDNSVERIVPIDKPPLLVFRKQDNKMWVIKSASRPTWVDDHLVRPLQASGDLILKTDTLGSAHK